jgi:hypothetical protein
VKPITRLYTAFATALLCATATGAENPNAAEAKRIVQQFASTLQGELKAGIQAGGPVKAIEICQERAPAIAEELSQQSGWSVGRTSLKLRNPDQNAPDDWERAVLQQFDQRQAAGEEVAPMAHAEVVETGDGRVFRFMKAIPTGDVCLACHGDQIIPEVARALDAAYPKDEARGYSLGQVRGAFTLSKPVD